MKIYSVPKDPSVIGIKDVNHAIISPIIEYLNKDDKVVIARYVEKHPELEDPAIVIQTTGDDTAKNAVMRAIDKIQSQLLSINEPEYLIDGKGESEYLIDGKGESEYLIDGKGESEYLIDGKGESEYLIDGKGKYL